MSGDMLVKQVLCGDSCKLCLTNFDLWRGLSPSLASDGQFLDAAISGAGSLAEPGTMLAQGHATGTHSLNDFCGLVFGILTRWYWVAFY